MNHFYYDAVFELEVGIGLPGLTVAYHTYGTLNAEKSNVVWICHALTASSDVMEWWQGMVGAGKAFDPEKYFIVCANILGSCYGTTGPLSINPQTGDPYYHRFPLITIRDMVNAHRLLCKHLALPKIYLLIGSSMGGYQALEWAFMEKDCIDRLFLLATSATESAWGIAVHTAQRLAIEADGTWLEASSQAGSKGLKAARAIGMLSYRNYHILVQKQTDPDSEKLDHFTASSYINYHGDKLINRFNAYCYWQLTRAMDTHHIARGRGGKPETVLSQMLQKTLIIGISSDILCPVQEQQFLACHLPNATLVEIDSMYGHDGFLLESNAISRHLSAWLNGM